MCPGTLSFNSHHLVRGECPMVLDKERANPAKDRRACASDQGGAERLRSNMDNIAKHAAIAKIDIEKDIVSMVVQRRRKERMSAYHFPITQPIKRAAQFHRDHSED